MFAFFQAINWADHGRTAQDLRQCSLPWWESVSVHLEVYIHIYKCVCVYIYYIYLPINILIRFSIVLIVLQWHSRRQEFPGLGRAVVPATGNSFLWQWVPRAHNARRGKSRLLSAPRVGLGGCWKYAYQEWCLSSVGGRRLFLWTFLKKINKCQARRGSLLFFKSRSCNHANPYDRAKAKQHAFCIWCNHSA